ncbi:MAG: SMP-30/gluconolactonase/LRE family protein [Acidobacteria bacterium]|nr:SMP-30/gluconolactonase/LRE family protein [Acidobacteriota bacterium]
MRKLLIAATLLPAASLWSASYYTQRLDDPRAVYLTPENFPVKADGIADDSAALQQAIDKVQETSGMGVLFVPEGRYRITRTIYVWPSIRVIGYGANRPVLVLADNTPGYNDAAQPKYMVFFAGGRPGSGRGPMARNASAQAGPPRDAGAGTFYSAMSNIDIEIGNGNPGAVGVRGKYAQHSFLAHIDFRTGSGLAGVHETGNVMEDVRFLGGQYGIWTSTPSPSWQFTAVDASFEGQRVAAVRDRAAALTMVRPRFRNVPTAIEIEPESVENLWIKDGDMEDISGPAIVISRETAARTQINLEGIVCRRVPQFAFYRQSQKKIAGPAEIYQVKVFAHGLHLDTLSSAGSYRTQFDAAPLQALPAPAPSDLTALPPAGDWVNVKTLGAKGDGATDDTLALRQAIAAHRTLYFPLGVYIVSDTLTLRPDSVLIAMHPSATRLELKDRTPAFQGIGDPVPVVLAPAGGANIMLGLGVYTNGVNPRATGVKWMSGAQSLMNDVRFHGGHGTPQPPQPPGSPGGFGAGIYNNTHTADPDLNRRWDAQYPSLWVTGGGTFLDIWTPSTFATAGMLVSDTKTPGRVYQMSSEHHVRYELLVRNASNWEFYAMQTESERGEGPLSSAIEIQDSSNLTFANTHIYRVISSYAPFPYAIKVVNSGNIRFRSMHSYSNSRVAYDATVYDADHDARLGAREFAWFTYTGKPPAARPAPPPAVLAPGAKVVKLAGGFQNICGGAAHPSGDYYFTDPYRQRIYKWSVAARRLSIVRDDALDPVNLAFDKAGNLMVVSSFGSNAVYTFRPDAPGLDITLLKPEPVVDRPGKTPVVAVGDWSLVASKLEKPAGHYVSLDGTTFIAAGREFVNDERAWGTKSSPVLRFGVQPAPPGAKAYFADEANVATFEGTVRADGSVTGIKQFVNQGGEAVTVDAQGNVYVANGSIYVYSPAGELTATIDVPERPINLTFAGKDKKTLFIAARTGLYAVQTRFGGR